MGPSNQQPFGVAPQFGGGQGPTETGDIILVPSEPVKDGPNWKKIGIIAGAIIVAGAICTTVAIVLTNQRREEIVAEATETVEAAFSEYRNYILGENAGAEYDSSEQYALDKVLDEGTQAEQKAFLKEAEEKYEKFLEVYGESEVKVEGAYEWLESKMVELEFLRAYVAVGQVSVDAVYEAYDEGGTDAGMVVVRKHYAALENLDSEDAKTYVGLIESYWDGYLRGLSGESVEVEEGVDYLSEARMAYSSVRKNVVYNCWAAEEKMRDGEVLDNGEDEE